MLQSLIKYFLILVIMKLKVKIIIDSLSSVCQMTKAFVQEHCTRVYMEYFCYSIYLAEAV